MIRKYATENGEAKAVKCFKEKDAKEISVRDWKKYLKKLNTKITNGDDDVLVKALPVKTRGRLPLIGRPMCTGINRISSYSRITC